MTHQERYRRNRFLRKTGLRYVQIQLSRHRIRPATLLFIIAFIGLMLGIFLAIAWNAKHAQAEEQITIPRAEIIEPVYASETAEIEATATPAPRVGEVKTAKVTAYSCGGLTTEAEIKMNCPSLKKYPNGRTASGTTPRPRITVACDRANMGKRFHLEGIGEVVCEDTGGAIKGAGRFDLYVTDVQEARKFGKQYIKYREVL